MCSSREILKKRVFINNLSLLIRTYFRHKLVALLCEHINMIAQNTASIECFKRWYHPHHHHRHHLTELLYISSSWSSVWRGPEENVTYEFVLNSPIMSNMSCSSHLDGFRDGRQVALYLLLCGMLLPGIAQYGSQHSCALTFKLFLNTLSKHPCSASI